MAATGLTAWGRPQSSLFPPNQTQAKRAPSPRLGTGRGAQQARGSNPPAIPTPVCRGSGGAMPNRRGPVRPCRGNLGQLEIEQ